MNSITLPDTQIIVPVRNGGERWREAAQALRSAVTDPSGVAVIDSSSTDGSDRLAADLLFNLERIDYRTFNHGRTRQLAVDRFCQGKKFVVFLTQDAVIEGPESLSSLLASFRDPQIGAAYGRQIPHLDARPFGRHSAAFLFPPTSGVRRLADARSLGLRAAYMSNSFAAYRLDALYECGGFPSQLILGEDTCVSAHMLQRGWALSYRADALVRHSHDYTVIQESQRYFDFGVFHAQLPELLREFGAPEAEGVRWVKSEIRYIGTQAPWRLPELVLRNAAKYLGYRLGRSFQLLPNMLRRRLSMTKGYWDPAPVHDGRGE